MISEFQMTQLLTKIDIIERIQMIRDNLEAYQDLDISNLTKQRQKLYHETILNTKQCLDDYIQMLRDLER